MAEADLETIAAYTFRVWGANQTAKYIWRLAAGCWPCIPNWAAPDEIRPGLRRMERGRHVIFYRQEERGIIVARILHERMLPERHDAALRSSRPFYRTPMSGQ